MNPDKVLTFLDRYPSSWPVALFFLVFLPALVAVSRSASLSAWLHRVEPRLLWLWSLGGIGIFAFCDLAYISSPAFFDFFEPCGASVAYTVFHGGVAFPDMAYAERYSLPYGPIFYLVLGFPQWLLGADTFSSKLPCCLVAGLAIGLFCWILRRRGLPALAVCALTALLATCLLAFRIIVFWAKSDGLILLLVTIGIWAAFRRRWLGSTLLGTCIGLGIGCKFTAAAYFLPILVIAFCTGWRWRDFVICGGTSIAFVLLPFVLLPGQFPWRPYLTFLGAVSQEVGLVPAFNYLRWVLMLPGLILVSDHFICRSITPQSRQRRSMYCAALACGFALVALPSCALGSGSHHLMPFVPLVFLAFGNLFDRKESLEWRYSRKPLWRAATYAILTGCALVAIQTATRLLHLRKEIGGEAIACETDLRQILTRHSQSTLLMGTSFGDEAGLPVLFRSELVFAGHPIGLDAAVVSDYQSAGVADPDLQRFTEEIHRRNPRPILWLLPRGGAPFTSTNRYNGVSLLYPEKFRRDFSDRFELRETTAFFDLYFPIEEH